MKKLFNYTLITVVTLLTLACDQDFDDINTNRVDPTSLSPLFLLNQGILDMRYREGTQTLQDLSYNFGIVQQIITPFGSSLAGANYNQLNLSNSQIIWQNTYRNALKNIVDAVEKSREDPLFANLHQSARIWKAYAFMVLTDNYGDVPYFQGGRGFIDQIVDPVYDTQEAIYADILKELEEATAALNPSNPTASSEILYGGSVEKWRKFGYSLMLRAAMRLTKVDPARAQLFVTKAVAGGLISANSENAVLRNTSVFNNHIGVHLGAREKANYYLTAPFVNHLKDSNDPRLRSISIRHVGATNGTTQTVNRITRDPALQIGMPMGHDDVSINTVLAANGVVSLWDFSQANIYTVLKIDAPQFFVTFAQTQLLLAEAAVRGWVQGNPSIYFATAIRANMEQMAQYDSDASVSEADIVSYIANNPLMTGRELEQINTEYWIASFLDGTELFANFRRSGYPLLQKNPYAGAEITGDFIRSMPYPDSERVVNNANLQSALSRQGPNNLDRRVWWDRP
ncbi:MAG: SusD/RagB family nutrient-binding outer membrane lipoprotein [Lunatimonas sp.]|uniref:SusD/RagB family nutrient-binding outer membrane lipoprotein n=1 Tax=Lunatimonas sp. TaxID=2060141 RepID=UPI00263A4A7F|nr:SusD/RagB family nutrient-binding outer membrane lipoprotein [Lunatimonas sp.]MCC5937523.1 SusD/RagB family nutrient-binding outer membrane lipoprotein [Lunatimonas sp.]